MDTAGQTHTTSSPTAEILVGKKVNEIRMQQGFSLRALAKQSGLNVNTLSLIENGKSSPSVSTLQQLASALNVPIGAFFESDPEKRPVVFTQAEQRSTATIGRIQMQNLAKDLTGSNIQSFFVSLEQGAGSGDHAIVHTGYEFIYCISGCIKYRIDSQDYLLKSGDSLAFESHLPHYWENCSKETAQFLLILLPLDPHEEPGCRHFSEEIIKNELCLKIAIVTDDKKTVSQHFGQASYFAVVTIDKGKIVHQEFRPKPGYLLVHNSKSNPEPQEPVRGSNMEPQQKHALMAEIIADCNVLICGSMGMGAFETIKDKGIRIVVTEISDIEEAISSFIKGKLTDHQELL